MRFTAVFALAVAVLPAANAFIAWSGDHCDGDQGADVGLDGTCHSFAGRHSFKAGTYACVKFYTLSNCSGERFQFNDQGTQCTNVNVGRNVVAFRPWPGSAGCPIY